MTFSSAMYSGLCASLASFFGKLSGLEFSIFHDVWLRYSVKLICFSLMLLMNGLVWTFFVKALQSSKSALEVTAVSTAINYMLSGILGFAAFGEVTGFMWWFGIIIVITGISLIND